MKRPCEADSQDLLHILLVDDNQHGLVARKTVLQEIGYHVVTTTCPREALKLAETQTFDLIVTDYKMPLMNGSDLIGHIRRQQPKTRIILLSGFADALGLNENNTGADAVLMKSATEVPVLIRTVARLMNRTPRKPVASVARAAAHRSHA